MGKTGIIGREEGSSVWAPYNTQSISIPNSTIEVFGHQTFTADAEKPIHVSLGDTINTQGSGGGDARKILATSTIESPRKGVNDRNRR